MFHVLGDAAIALGDRAKIAKGVWRDDTVVWPNKEQCVLDWVSRTLQAGRGSLDDPKYEVIWKLLQNIFVTNEFKAGPHGEPLQLKPALIQLLLDELNLASRCYGTRDYAFSCCYSLILSPEHASSFTNKFDNSLQFLIAALRLTTEQIRATQSFEKRRLTLLKISIEKFTHALACKANRQQVLQQMSAKLLEPAYQFMSTTIKKHLLKSEELSGIIPAFVAALSQGLFPRELCSQYELFLRLKTETSTATPSAIPKIIDAFFSSFLKTMSMKESCEEEPLSVWIQMIYTLFGTSYRHGSKSLSIQFLQYTCEQLGVILAKLPGKTDALTTVESEQENKVVRQSDEMQTAATKCTEAGADADGQSRGLVLRGSVSATCRSIHAQLVKLVDLDLYDVAADHLSGGAHVRWLAALADWLLAQEERNSCWYRCLGCILKLNHVPFESRLVAVLTQTWLTHGKSEAGDEEEVVRSQGALLRDLVLLYGRLRQIPKLIQGMLTALKAAHLTTAVTWHKEFNASLCDAVCGLPPSVTVEIWQAVLTELTDQYMSLDKWTKSEELQFTAMSYVMTLVMEHAQVADQSLAHQVAGKAERLIVNTSERLLKPSLERMATKFLPTTAAAVLLAANSWGDLVLAVNHVTLASSAHVTPPASASPWMDITCLHAYVTPKVWKTLADVAGRTKAYASQYAMAKLASQKVHALLAQSLDLDAASLTSVWNVFDHLLSSAFGKGMEVDGRWDGQMPVSPESYPVAVWQLVCHLLPVAHLLCSEAHLEAIARHLVETLKTTKPAGGDAVSMASASRSLITGAAWNEMGALQQGVLLHIWHRLAATVGNSDNKNKKRRSGTSDDGLKTILCGLSEVSPSFFTSEKDDGDFNERLASLRPRRADEASLREMTSLLEILKLLPLEFLSPSNKRRCILGLVALLRSTPADSSLEVVELCLNMILALLDCPRGKFILLDPTQIILILKWIASRDDWGALSVNVIRLEQLLVKLSLWWPKHAVALLEYVKQMKQNSVGVVPLLCTVAEATSKMVTKVHIASDIINANREILASVAPWLRGMLVSSGSRDTLDPVSSARLLQAFASHILSCGSANRRREAGGTGAGVAEAGVAAAAEAAVAVTVPSDGEEDDDEAKVEDDVDDDGASNEEDNDDVEDEEDDDQSATSGDNGNDVIDDTMAREEEAMEQDPDGEAICVATAGSRRLLEAQTLVVPRGEAAGYVREGLPLLADACETCLKLLKHPEVSHMTVGFCLQFIRSLCLCPETIRAAIQEQFWVSCWDQLLRHLRVSHVYLPSHESSNNPEKQLLDLGATFADSLKTHTAVQSKVKPVPDFITEVQKHLARSTGPGGVAPGDIARPPGKGVVEEEDRMPTHRVLGLIVVACRQEVALRLLQQLLTSVNVSTALREPGKVVTSLDVWTCFLRSGIKGEVYEGIRRWSQELLLRIQQVMSGLSGSWSTKYCHLVLAALTMQTELLSCGSGLLKDQGVSLCLHSCQMLPLEDLPLQQYKAHFQAGISVLREALVTRPEIVCQWLPAFISAATRLMKSIIWEGRQRAETSNDRDLRMLLECAQLLERLLTLLSSQKTDMAKVAVYLVADYVTCAQRVTLAPQVKKSLLPGVYSLLEICDEYSISLLHTALNASSKELFRSLYSDYVKYYKYTGRV